MAPDPIRVLRPSRASPLVSSRFFDQSFAANLQPDIDIDSVPLIDWCDTLLGSPRAPIRMETATRNFERLTSGYPFLCPSYECIALVPLFASFRNRAGAPVRLLILAHAPGAFALEWAMLKPLLVPGDLIIAPSQSALRTIEFLCPELIAFVRVIPHPIHSLVVRRSAGSGQLVSLQRLHPEKLVHRQIDAVHVLKGRGVDVRLRIVGPLSGESSDAEPHAYARALFERARRLGISDRIEFVGTVDGDAAKADLLANADLLLSPSVCVEEAFPKASVEALAAGVPVVGTMWDGLVETVGKCGELVKVDDIGPGYAMDVSGEALAGAIEQVLADPPDAASCVEHARQFSPDVVRPIYREMLGKGAESERQYAHWRSRETVTSEGLLGVTAPLTGCTHDEMFAALLDEQRFIREAWRTPQAAPLHYLSQLRSLLLDGIRTPLQRFLAGCDWKAAAATGESDRECRPASADMLGDWITRSFTTKATLVSKRVCLAFVKDALPADVFSEQLEQMNQVGSSGRGTKYLMTDCLRRAGQFEQAYSACAGEEDPVLWGEHGASWLRLLARICREWQRPELALARLREWLAAYPDTSDSAPVWIDLAVNAQHSGTAFLPECETALDRAELLLGPIPIIAQIRDTLVQPQETSA